MGTGSREGGEGERERGTGRWGRREGDGERGGDGRGVCIYVDIHVGLAKVSSTLKCFIFSAQNLYL